MSIKKHSQLMHRIYSASSGSRFTANLKMLDNDWSIYYVPHLPSHPPPGGSLSILFAPLSLCFTVGDFSRLLLMVAGSSPPSFASLTAQVSRQHKTAVIRLAGSLAPPPPVPGGHPPGGAPTPPLLLRKLAPFNHQF